ncbi:MAG: ABC transporter ATP-binding protein [Acidobacteria bacterium]|nr:MAG: ABC transporter ATP-binding protein [Acidobacteriota bacterium]
MSLVSLHNICRIYGSVVTALDNVSLSVCEGETIALLGPSGSGKSTLLNIIAGFETPSSGSLTVSGKSINDWHPDDFRLHMVGFLFQQFHLVEHLSAVRNVELALFPTCRHPRQRFLKSSQLLRDVGLGKRLQVQAADLSGGERQRVAFCRSIANQPRLLLADEPTGNLDEASSQMLLSTLTDHMQNHGTTLIVATHDDDVARICSRIVRLKDGKVVDE